MDKINANEEKAEVDQDQMKAGQEGLIVNMRTDQEKMEAAVSAIHSAQTNFEETVSKCVEGVLTQSLCKELSSKIQEKKEALQKKLSSEVQGT
jgi:hypothetical protein